MRHASTARPARQVAAACRRLADSPGLPFADRLPEQQVEDAVRAQGVSFRNRLFSPPVTLWTFLSQVRDPDPSCRQAVARYGAWRVARGLPACSSDTGA